MANSGQRQEKGPEKSNFMQTCNLLSQFMKGKGVLVNSGSNQADSTTKQQPPVDRSINIVEEASNKASTSKDATKADPETAQLTIFYDGRVLVFDDYPANRARELVSLAKKGSSKVSYGILSNTFHENTSNSSVGASTSSPRQGLPPRPRVSTISEKHVGISSNTCKEITNSSAAEAVATSSRSEIRLSPPTEANDSDLPIARRSSLYRFLEKRKDRAGARGPYQLQEPPPARPSSSKCDEQFDLNL